MITPPEIIEVPPDQLPTVVTCLQMVQRPHDFPGCDHPNFDLISHPKPDLNWYLRLYRYVGANWLWSWRLALPQEELARIVHDPLVSVFSLRYRELDEGLLELDFRTDGECELKLLGVSPMLMGKGAGRWLICQALRIAWKRSIDRMWLHTCSMDHPAALDFYISSGFKPYRRYVEIAADPRPIGLLAIDAGTHIPMLVPIDDNSKSLRQLASDSGPQ
jgi:GNAT superfamily N-acetyltransferase